MDETTRMLRGREYCRFCLKTLDPNDADETQRSFVQCNHCGHLYHAGCYTTYPRCSECGNSEAYPVHLVGTVGSLRLLHRQPIDVREYDQPNARRGRNLLYLAGAVSFGLCVIVSVLLLTLLNANRAPRITLTPTTGQVLQPSTSMTTNPPVVTAQALAPTAVLIRPLPTQPSTPLPTLTFTPLPTLTLRPTLTFTFPPTDTLRPTLTFTFPPTDTLRPTPTDAFRANLTGWTQQGDGGRWSTVSEGLRGSVENRTDSFYVAQNGFADLTFETTFVMTSGYETAAAGVIFHSNADPLQGSYLVRLSVYNGGEIALVKFYPVRQYQQLTRVNLPIALNTRYTLQVTTNNSEISVFLNGVPVIHTYDASFSSGVVGLNINSSTTIFFDANTR